MGWMLSGLRLMATRGIGVNNLGYESWDLVLLQYTLDGLALQRLVAERAFWAQASAQHAALMACDN